MIYIILYIIYNVVYYIYIAYNITQFHAVSAPPSLPSFSIQRNTRCQYGRQAQLYWKVKL